MLFILNSLYQKYFRKVQQATKLCVPCSKTVTSPDTDKSQDSAKSFGKFNLTRLSIQILRSWYQGAQDRIKERAPPEEMSSDEEQATEADYKVPPSENPLLQVTDKPIGNNQVINGHRANRMLATMTHAVKKNYDKWTSKYGDIAPEEEEPPPEEEPPEETPQDDGMELYPAAPDDDEDGDEKQKEVKKEEAPKGLLASKLTKSKYKTKTRGDAFFVISEPIKKLLKKWLEVAKKQEIDDAEADRKAELAEALAEANEEDGAAAAAAGD